jgi:branched-chain amino acid transport system ATP-binding protein
MDTLRSKARRERGLDRDVGPLLEVEGMDLSYGPLQVLFDVSIEVATGERVGLLGTNGAGKSSLLRGIAGLTPPSRGTVRFDGADVSGLDPDRRFARGLTMIAGGRAIFPSLSVLDNIRLGGSTATDRAAVDLRFEEAIGVFPALRSRLDQAAGTLSGGEQQMVALARAFVAAPRLLMIDELSLGLAPVVMAEIMRMIDELVARGTTLLIVEQSVNVALSITERAYFMERGAIRFAGPTEQLLERTDLVRSVFFGESRPSELEGVSL